MPNGTIAEAAARPPRNTGGGDDRSPGGAVAQWDPDTSAGLTILRSYWPQLRTMLPSHVRKDAWYAAVYAALYRGQDPRKNIDLARAADRNPQSLMFALLDAARQGLEPGTEQYYLTPRPNRNARGGVEVLGIRGYQGEIELMYNAGARSVVVEVVRQGGPKGDLYRRPRVANEPPTHEFEPFARKADRGELVGVYAYAVLAEGSISQVIQLGQDDIDRAKRASGSAGKGTTFWDDEDDEVAMWKKTAIHRLRKFVPTSAERLFTLAAAQASAVALGGAEADRHRQLEGGDRTAVLSIGGASIPPEVNGDGPADPLHEGMFAQPAAPDDAVPGELAAGGFAPDPDAPPPTGDPATQGQHRSIMRLLGKHLDKSGGAGEDAHRHAVFSTLLGRPITSGKDLTTSDASFVHDRLTVKDKADELGDWVRSLAPTPDQPTSDDAADASDPANLPAEGTRAFHDQQHPRLLLDGSVETAERRLDGSCGICETGDDQ